MKKEIELWGSFPNPIGGVSIHILRLLISFSDIFNIEGVNFSKDSVLYKHSKIRQANSFIKELFRIIFIDKSHYIHLHSNSLIPVTILSFLIKDRLLITLHNKRILNYLFFKKWIYLLSLKQCNAILINDTETYNFLLSYKIPVYQTPAYIPPLQIESHEIPVDFELFRRSNNIVISMSIWNFNYSKDDIYGTQYIIPLLKLYRNLNIGFCLCISNVQNKNSLDFFYREIYKEKLEDNILLLINKVSNGSTIWKESDIFFRPTSTDSEAISVKEALVLNTPVIASNVCNRPDETIIFDYNNWGDLETKFENLLYNLPAEQKKLITRSDEIRYRETGLPLIEKLYSRILA